MPYFMVGKMFVGQSHLSIHTLYFLPFFLLACEEGGWKIYCNGRGVARTVVHAHALP